VKEVETKEEKAILVSFFNVLSKDALMTSSEIGWLSNSKFILTLNNDYFLVNLTHKNLTEVENNIQYGRQHLNTKMFVSILKQNKPSQKKNYLPNMS
jgi:hypothetical protein